MPPYSSPARSTLLKNPFKKYCNQKDPIGFSDYWNIRTDQQFDLTYFNSLRWNA